MTSISANASPSGYWYEGAETARSVDVLNAMRDYRAAEAAMRRRTRSSMGMGETDLLAIRLLLQAERTGHSLSPKDLSQGLGISSASTTILIDRLVKSGHVERRPHPTDRRALIIVPTTDSDTEVRATLSRMHARMLDIAAALPADEADTVVRFLRSMTVAVDAVDSA